MVSGLDGHAWFGLVVYFTVMGLVIRGVRIPLPRFVGRPLRSLATLIRLCDPPPVHPRRPDSITTPPTPRPSSGGSTTDVRTSPRPSLRSRSESKIGTPADETVETSAVGVNASPSESDERLVVTLDLRTAPVAGVILLLITRTIDGSVVRLGIVGEDGVRPYDVLVLFIALAYISTALDSTGALRALSFLITQKSARPPKLSSPSAERTVNGPRLYTLLYAFWFASGVVVGNDPIVLSGTAFLAYFTRFSGIADPTAWTFSQFIAANVASAALVSSNPTNVLIAGAFKLNFITGYTAFTILPSVLTAAIAFPLTYFSFTLLHPPSRDSTDGAHARQDYIPKEILPPDVDPKSALLDRSGAIFHTTLMLVTLAVLVGTTFVPGEKVQVWMVTAAGGLIAFFRDIWSERNRKAKATLDSQDDIELDAAGVARPPPPPSTRSRRLSLPGFLRFLSARFPTTSSTISRLPLSLLPFAGGVFVLARALTSLGWTTIWAGWLAKICTTPAGTVFFIGYFIPFVLCPLAGTNIGAAILAVEIISDARFALAPHVVADPRIMAGAIFSTAMASNVGAISWTFSASLAGLLWESILRQKGIKVGARTFAGWNLWFLPVLATTASAVVLLEICHFSLPVQ